MIIYLVIFVALLVLDFLCYKGKMLPRELTDSDKIKYFKITEMIVTSALALAFLLFAFGEMFDVVYKAFNILAIIIIVLSIAYYFYAKYQYNRLPDGGKNNDN